MKPRLKARYALPMFMVVCTEPRGFRNECRRINWTLIERK